jgi:ribose/xylose/arabinose/galactoside ABC-type transport system permease subunit
MTRPPTEAGPIPHPRWTPPRIIWPILAIVLLLGYHAVRDLFFGGSFLEIELSDWRLRGSLIDIADRAAPLILVSLGMTLVIATAGVDLSVGATMAIAGALAAGLVAQPEYSVLSQVDLGGSFAAAIVIALLVSAIVGAFNGSLVSAFGVQPIVATLILMVAGRGIAQLLTSGQVVTFEHPSFAFLGNGYVVLLPFAIVVAGAAFVLVLLLVRATALGLFIESVGGNAVAARHAGVPTRWIRLSAYLVCGLLAGLAGLLVAGDIGAADANHCGLYMELDAILAVVIGGTALTGGRFSLAGSVIGALLIQAVTTTILSEGIPVEFTLVVKAAVVIAVCLLQSDRFRAAALGSLRRAPA